MNKRTFYFNNATKKNIKLVEFNVSLPPGVSDLFKLNEHLTYEQIDYCMRHGTLRSVMDSRLCWPVPDPINQKSLSDDILIKPPLEIQVFPSRVRFINQNTTESSVFDDNEDYDLFHDEEVMPARLLEEEMKRSKENIQSVEATIRQSNIHDKPIENKYVPPQIKPEAQEKIKNDIIMKYETCAGHTADGKRCLRQAKKNKRFCGLHLKQAK
jgi:hypothetical protein